MIDDITKKTANTIRGLSIDAIQKANSGHPGLPMGMADVGTILFSEFLKFNPHNPEWFNRDRFVLSGGHGSMLLYSLLHLYGYDLSLNDIKDFRQWQSKTPGHPEVQDTPGVETTTGPLGQGLANAVGMALAESHLAAIFNRDKNVVIDHCTYVMAGDGDLQEGVSHEACSFAGHNKLGKLLTFYDANDITIDGSTELSFSEDIKKRFESYNWHVQTINGHNYDEIRNAIKQAQLNTDKPSIIICRTIIGFGSPNKQGTADSHGSPLGVDEVKLSKETLKISAEDFYIPEDVWRFTQEAIERGKDFEGKWNEKQENYKKSEKTLYGKLIARINNEIPEFSLPQFETGTKIATRSASGKILDSITSEIDILIGGSADLSPSNKTKAKSQTIYNPDNREGTYIHYGVREFGMGAIMNGMALHGGVVPYGGTFFVFADYMRPAIRMAALMGLRIIYVFTHDSIGLGEDGPTHQPIEHLASLRAIPNLLNFRPMDAAETCVAWKIALQRTNGPTSLVLTRQNLPVFDRGNNGYADFKNAEKGAYVLVEDDQYEAIIISSGSEVEIALKAKDILNAEGRKVRVVSMPSTELFDEQDEEYRNRVLPKDFENIVAVEAASCQSWYKYVGKKGKIVGLDSFGASAPFEVLYEKFGITAENVVTAVESLLK